MPSIRACPQFNVSVNLRLVAGKCHSAYTQYEESVTLRVLSVEKCPSMRFLFNSFVIQLNLNARIS